MIQKSDAPDSRLRADWMARVLLVFGHVLVHVAGTSVAEQGKFARYTLVCTFVRLYVCVRPIGVGRLVTPLPRHWGQ